MLFVFCNFAAYKNNFNNKNKVFMRRINDFSSIKQLLFDVHRNKMEIEKESEKELQVICPYLPSFLVSRLSSSVSVGVYPCGESVLIFFDKL